jgi:hypothetical protein
MTGNAAVMMKSIISVLHGQRAFTRGNTRHEAARRLGIARVHNHFTELVIDQVHAHIAAREWSPALSKAWTLLRWHPGIVPQRAGMKWRRLTSSHTPSDAAERRSVARAGRPAP